ncbi:MAG TPA: hypothetical protein VN634_19650 [Candidatus Limnocylindrales bacterium]|nr:hypothetical protein [Candidatus Limnocylindrales bacterium]
MDTSAHAQAASRSEFHIHVDPIDAATSFEELLLAEGFVRVEYALEPSTFETNAADFCHDHHLTYKTFSSREYKKVSDFVFALLDEGQAIRRGYVECECVTFREALPQAPYRSNPLPFRLEMSSPSPSAFRESEIHVTLDSERSDPRLLKKLREIGMLKGTIPKPWGKASIFTAQGTQEQIDRIREPLWDFLRRSGGGVRCTIKEEKTVRYWLSHAVGIGLPQVISTIGN